MQRNPVIQAKAQANWMKSFVSEFLRMDITVKPVVLFPGWFIDSTNKFEVWVLEPKALDKFIENQDVVLNQNTVIHISNLLSKFLRVPIK